MTWYLALGDVLFGAYELGTGATIGREWPSQATVSAYDAEDGLAMMHKCTSGNSFLGNSNCANGYLGIDLKDDGVTPSDGQRGDGHHE